MFCHHVLVNVAVCNVVFTISVEVLTLSREVDYYETQVTADRHNILKFDTER